jgi:hypothetical protein
MNKQQILNQLRASAIEAFGSENCYGIQKASGLSWHQINAMFDLTRKPSLDAVLKYAESVKVKIEAHDWE